MSFNFDKVFTARDSCRLVGHQEGTVQLLGLDTGHRHYLTTASRWTVFRSARSLWTTRMNLSSILLAVMVISMEACIVSRRLSPLSCEPEALQASAAPLGALQASAAALGWPLRWQDRCYLRLSVVMLLSVTVWRAQTIGRLIIEPTWSTYECLQSHSRLSTSASFSSIKLNICWILWSTKYIF